MSCLTQPFLRPDTNSHTHSLVLFPHTHTLYGLLSTMFVSFCVRVRCGCAAVQFKYLKCDWILIKSEQRKWQPNDDVSYLRSLQMWRIARQTLQTCVRRVIQHFHCITVDRASVIGDRTCGVCRSVHPFRQGVLVDSRLAHIIYQPTKSMSIEWV